MNILPHKSWHVRTKKNIARVRKDEAEAAEKEKEKQRRIQLAAQESRTAFLRDRANQRVVDTGEDLPIPLAQVADLTQGDGHINFFQDLEDGKKLDSEVNKEHEVEKKKEQEDYEKKIGYLVYLGQNSIEQTKDRPWYESSSVARDITSLSKPKQSTSSAEASSSDLGQLKLEKFKEFEDPLKDIRKYLSTSGVKKCAETETSRKRKSSESTTTSISESKKRKDHKLHKSKKSKKHRKSKKEKKTKRSKHHKSSSSSNSSGSDSDSEDIEKQKRLEQLRSERLEREREERRKTEKLLASLRGDVPEVPATDQERERKRSQPSDFRAPIMKQKYNSQFNPQLARQNYDD